MLYAIVPAQNEGDRISKVLNHLYFVGIKKIVVVANGCTDNTVMIVSSNYPKVDLIVYKESLGIDVAKAIGCKWSIQEGGTNFLFYDGDLVGEITTEIKGLIDYHFNNKCDLTLTDCYPYPLQFSSIPKRLILPRLHLNELLGIESKLGISTPSHGPHLISKKLLDFIDFVDLAVPPVVLVKAVKAGLRVEIGAKIPHIRLGSNVRDCYHTKAIFDTLWGDYGEAVSVYLGLPRNRFLFGTEYDGYNSKRRFDLLEAYINKISAN